MVQEIESQEHLSDLKKSNPELMMILFHSDTSEKSNEALDILAEFHKKIRIKPYSGLMRQR